MNNDLFLRDIFCDNFRPEELADMFETFFNYYFKSIELILIQDYIHVKIMKQSQNTTHMYGFMKLDSTINKNKLLFDYFKKHKIFFRQQEVFIRSNDQISSYQENLKNTDICDCIKHFEIYEIVKLDKQSFTPLWTFIDSKEKEIDQVITPTIKELFPDEQLIITNEIYKKELDNVLQRAEELKCLIRGNEEMQMAQGRLQLVEISLKVHHQQIIKEKQEMQAQQMKMKTEIAKQINAIACFSEAFKTHVDDGQRIIDQQQLKCVFIKLGILF